MLKILVTGKNGQVGFELLRSLAVLGEVIGVDIKDCNLADSDSVRKLVRTIEPDMIVHPAAYTAVDQAESEVALAQAINVTASGILAEEAAKRKAPMIYYSTDYVFDGMKQGIYTEEDKPRPQSVYGQTKFAGEEAIIAANPRHIIMRTSWVFGVHGNNFLKTILDLAHKRKSLKIVNDQFGAPTSSALLADVTAQIVGRYICSPDKAHFPYGLYHLVSSGETSWHGYARYIIQSAIEKGSHFSLHPDHILPVSTSAYPMPAKRPAHSRLSTKKLSQTFGLRLPAWEAQVEHILTLLECSWSCLH